MLKQIKKIELNFALIAFIAFSVKVLVFDASIADSLILGVLSGLYGYTQYLKRFQPYNLDEEVRADLSEVKSALSSLNMTRGMDSTQKKKYF